MRKLIGGVMALALGACAYPYTPPALAPIDRPAPAAAGVALPTAQAASATATAPVADDAPVTILVSIDGFRPDYLDRGVTPALGALAAGGVTARMRPAFPSKTFPNHWTLVTGLVPDRHGIVANTMEDPTRPGETFTMTTDDPFWWNAAEPIWVTAERAGIRTATMFWPGANVGWGGTRATAWPHDISGATRPQDWAQFNQALTSDQRVDAVIDWLRRPAATRPRFVTLYFDQVDTAGHRFGPDAAQTTAAVAEADRSIARLVAGLRELGRRANLVIVADHGMAAVSLARTIALDRIAAPADYRVEEVGPYAGLYPVAGHEAALAKALLRPHPHLDCWRKGEIPARFHYGRNPRVPPFFCLAETGWTIARTMPTSTNDAGAHGYDNEDPTMRALFVANGPSFAAGRRIADFDNVDVAPLLRDLLGLPAGRGLDGDDAPFRAVLTRGAR